jgi:hypothetical protein
MSKVYQIPGIDTIGHKTLLLVFGNYESLDLFFYYLVYGKLFLWKTKLALNVSSHSRQFYTGRNSVQENAVIGFITLKREKRRKL